MAYDVRISDWSSDECSSDLRVADIGNANVDAEIAALVRGVGLETHGFLLVHADARAVEIDVEGDRLGHAVEGEVAGDLRLVAFAVEDDAGRHEFGVSGVGAEEVGLAAVLAGAQQMFGEAGDRKSTRLNSSH